MPAKQTIVMRSIGRCALGFIQNYDSAKVMGITSKGLFLNTPNRHVLFLTSQPFRGPLTVNLPQPAPYLENFSSCAIVEITPNAVSMVDYSIEFIVSKSTQVYLSVDLKKTPLLLPDFQRRANRIRAALPDEPDSMIGWDQETGTKLKDYIKKDDISGLVFALSENVGRGSGLTPAGDDFICGFMLAMESWGKTLVPHVSFRQLVLNLQKVADQKTTSLSANLIACAAQGAADERIINCLLWLHSGQEDFSHIIEELQSYGSSSWQVTLRGIFAAVECICPV